MIIPSIAAPVGGDKVPTEHHDIGSESKPRLTGWPIDEFSDVPGRTPVHDAPSIPDRDLFVIARQINIANERQPVIIDDDNHLLGATAIDLLVRLSVYFDRLIHLILLVFAEHPVVRMPASSGRARESLRKLNAVAGVARSFTFHAESLGTRSGTLQLRLAHQQGLLFDCQKARGLESNPLLQFPLRKCPGATQSSLPAGLALSPEGYRVRVCWRGLSFRARVSVHALRRFAISSNLTCYAAAGGHRELAGLARLQASLVSHASKVVANQGPECWI